MRSCSFVWTSSSSSSSFSCISSISFSDWLNKLTAPDLFVPFLETITNHSSTGSFHFWLISMHVEVPHELDATVVKGGKNNNSFGTPMELAWLFRNVNISFEQTGSPGKICIILNVAQPFCSTGYMQTCRPSFCEWSTLIQRRPFAYYWSSPVAQDLQIWWNSHELFIDDHDALNERESLTSTMTRLVSFQKPKDKPLV